MKMAIWIKRYRRIGHGVHFRQARGFPPLQYQLAALRGGRPDCAWRKPREPVKL
jgi:hypothetical protein